MHWSGPHREERQQHAGLRAKKLTCVNNREHKASAYFTLVHQNLEYCVSVWSPYTAQGKYKIEMVQRWATRCAVNRYRNTSSVTEMLEDLGWETLESRRAKIQWMSRHQPTLHQHRQGQDQTIQKNEAICGQD